MTGRARISELCAAMPGAEWSESFGPGIDVWKVGGKMFACAGGTDGGVSVKTPDVDTAAMLIDAGVAVRAPYFHRSWVRLPSGAPEDELAHRIVVSYDIVRRSLTRKAQAALPPRETA